jgi:tetratricopeptide (TPR) repeat protein
MNKIVTYLAKAKPVLAKAKPVLTHIKTFPFDKNVSYIFSRVKALIFVLMCFKFCTILTTNHYILKPFSVPPAFERNGYNGTMLTGQVVNYMEDIRQFKDSSTSRGNAYRQLGKTFKESDVSLYEDSKEPTIYDPDTWFKAGKKILSSMDRFKEKSISASIVENPMDSTTALLTIQVTNRPVSQTPIPHPRIGDKTFFHFIAFEILAETDPIALFDYYLKDDKLLDRAEKLLSKLNHNDEFRRDRTNQLRLEVSTINLKLAKAHSLRRSMKVKQEATDPEKEADRTEQNKLRNDALDCAHHLIEHNPGDLSAYVQEFSCLAFNVSWLNYLDPKRDAADLAQGKQDFDVWKKHFDELLKKFKEEESNLKTEFYDAQQSKAYINATIGFLATQFDATSKFEVKGYYEKALAASPEDVFILNAVAYFYSTGIYKDKKKAFEYIEKAVSLKPYDGNLMDSYSDIALIFNDTATFYTYFEKALDNPKAIDGITREEYEKEATNRLKDVWHRPRFQQIMRQHGSTLFDVALNQEENSTFVATTTESSYKPVVKKKRKV